MKIYTKTGDRGETALLGRTRVGKDHPRVSAYGDIDELNAVLGLAKSHARDAELSGLLQGLQRDLFALGAQLADPGATVGTRRAKAAITGGHVRRLERAIDSRQPRLAPLRAFVLPGGSRTGAILHLARTVCRRAERSIVALGRREKLDPRILAYLNRLSDLLFVLARFENHREGEAEDQW